MFGKTIDLVINAAKHSICVDADHISHGNADFQSIISTEGALKGSMTRFQLMVRKNLTVHRIYIDGPEIS